MKEFLPFLLFLISFTCQAQTLSSHLAGAAVVEVDLKTGLVKDEAPVPYATRLIFRMKVPDSVDQVPLKTLYAFQKNGNCDAVAPTLSHGFELLGGWDRPDTTIGGSQDTAEFISVLRGDKFFQANRNYCLVIRRYSDTATADSKQQTISIRTVSKFADHVKLDFGLGYSPRPNALFGTAAAHLHFLPTNEYVNLAENFGFRRQLLMRTSVFAGIAPVTLASNTKQDMKSQTAVGNVVFGFGFRAPFFYPRKNNNAADYLRTALTPKGLAIKDFMQAIRLNVGWMVFKQADPSPLISSDHTKVEPFVSLTYDATLSSLLAPIALLLGFK